MNIKSIEERVSNIKIPVNHDFQFIYDLLLAYGKSQASITRLQKGDYNLSNDKSNEIYWKNNILFRHVPITDLHLSIDDLSHSNYGKKLNPRFILVTDYKQLLAIDTKTNESLDIEINEVSKYFSFFLPWAGMEKSQFRSENAADIKAAERMARLYDEIVSLEQNDHNNAIFYHQLNIFFSRLLFCFFAEDTDVFEKNQFTNSISSFTQTDGSDLNFYLDELFLSLDKDDKSGYPSHIATFPYVNGGLFNKPIAAPFFSQKARKLILECGELNWSEINPDIFGSMIQAVVHPGQRAGLGMHYTSVVNIMKVIEPLFLVEIKEELDNAHGNVNALKKLLDRIYKIKVFDPACGSGNFLIIAYKELRKIEHEILEELLKGKLAVKINSGLKLENYYGIEIDDFAKEIAVLSLWLAKHQMNIEFRNRFGKDIPLIPLKDSGNILCANSAQIDWNTACPVNEDDEVYIISNPPYLGSRNQSVQHKEDMTLVLNKLKNYKVLDYIAIWFYKGAKFIDKRHNSKLAYVSTNSLSQGDQVAIFWPTILNSLEIGFAYKSFKWSNNAKKNAGVTVVIISLQTISNKSKKLYENQIMHTVPIINAYLIAAPLVFIGRRSKPLASLPEMSYGNYTGGCESLILSPIEKDELIRNNFGAERFVRRLIGSAEINKGIERYCLWIKDNQLDEALKIPDIAKRIELVRQTRLSSKDPSLNKLATRPHQFRDFKEARHKSLIVPIVFSERRDYITCDFLDASVIIPNSAQAIYDPETYLFGIISSRLHMIWVKAVSGRLKTDIRYSSAIAYNNFPMPRLQQKQIEMITNHSLEIINAREAHTELTLGEMYDPNKIPGDLLQAHNDLDEVVERCYRVSKFQSDEDRLSYLFKLYEIMALPQKELL